MVVVVGVTVAVVVVAVLAVVVAVVAVAVVVVVAAVIVLVVVATVVVVVVVSARCKGKRRTRAQGRTPLVIKKEGGRRPASKMTRVASDSDASFGI